MSATQTQRRPATLPDSRPWFTYERISKTRSGNLAKGDGRGGLVGEDAQHDVNVAYIHSQDESAEIVDWRDNASGWDTATVRKDWQAMLDAIRRGEARGVVAWHADRYTRQLPQLLELIAACEAGRCELHTAMGGHHEDPTMIQIEGVLAAKESRVKSQRQKLKHGVIAMEGRAHGGRRAYGYTKERDKLVEHEAEHIRWAARQLLAGRSIRSITAGLTERGAVTVSGAPWRAGNLGTYLRRPMLAGLRVHHGEIMETPATWPALLELGQWQAVRTLLENPERRVSKSAPRVYLLSGIARCGGCGGPMRGRSNATQDLPPSYFCQTRAGCAFRRADLVDAQTRAVVVALLAKVDSAGQLSTPSDPSQGYALQEAIRDLEARGDALVRLFTGGHITERQLLAGKDEAATELASLRTQLDALELDARRPVEVLEGLAGMANAAELYDAMSLERRRAVVAQLVTVTIVPGARGRKYDASLVKVERRT